MFATTKQTKNIHVFGVPKIMAFSRMLSLSTLTWLTFSTVVFTKSRRSPRGHLTCSQTLFDNSTWMYILLSMMGLTLHLNQNFTENSSTSLLSSASSLFDFGTQSLSGHSGVFILWMGISLILITFYSGEITSTIISSPPEERMSSNMQ